VSKKVEPRNPFSTPGKLPVLKDERIRHEEQVFHGNASPMLGKKASLKMPLPPNSDVKIREMHGVLKPKQSFF